MGSYCELYFDDISIASSKSWIIDEFVFLFQESDRRVTQRVAEDDEEDNDVQIGYFSSRAVVLRRLELGGYTAAGVRRAFDDWLRKEQERWVAYAKDGDWAKKSASAIQTFTFESWQERAKDVLITRYNFPEHKPIDEIDRHMHDSEGWLFFGDDLLMVLRGLLDALPDVRNVSLDITDLIAGGWIEEEEPVCQKRRMPDAHIRSILEPAVIVAEGSTDTLILRRSLDRLYPELADYVTFFDYENSNADGGASFVVKFLRAFSAARINTLIIALFDNDAAGTESFNVAKSLTLPVNIKVAKLPEIDIAKSYPTIGPQGNHHVDINGSAVGIELFLGRSSLMDSNGTLGPILWSKYFSKLKLYQGALQDKATPLARFLNDTEQHNDDLAYKIRYPELVILWEHIFGIIREGNSLSGRDEKSLKLS